MKSIIEQLKSYRLAMGYKQALMGEKIGLPQSHLSKIESGATDPRLSTVLDMARALDQELVLIPRQLLPQLRVLVYGQEEDERRWQLDDEGDS
jgi:HTH-type transcriptional regulator/antitoxin HipB